MKDYIFIYFALFALIGALDVSTPAKEHSSCSPCRFVVNVTRNVFQSDAGKFYLDS